MARPRSALGRGRVAILHPPTGLDRSPPYLPRTDGGAMTAAKVSHGATTSCGFRRFGPRFAQA